VVSFLIETIRNPPSTIASSVFTGISINTSGGTYQVSSFADTLTVTNTELATIDTMVLTQADEDFGVSTTYEFAYDAASDYEAGAAWWITVSSVVNMTDFVSFDTCTVDHNGVTTAMACTYSSGLRAIKVVTDGTDVAAITKGDTVTLSLSTLVNPETPFETQESFQFSTFKSSSFQYAYDEVTTGVVPVYQCDAPC